MNSVVTEKPLPAFGPDPSPPRGLWKWVRGVFGIVGVWTFLIVLITCTLVFATVTLGAGVDRYKHLVARACGRVGLWLVGVRLTTSHFERASEREAKLMFFNHTSQLDLLIFGALYPKGATAIAKRELRRIPFIGWALWLFGFYFIDRGNLAESKSTLDDIARRARDDGATIMIAPEGTRTKDGLLQGFKKGPFHLAAATRLPIVCAVVHGAYECQGPEQLFPTPGTVHVDFLPALNTTGFAERSAGDNADAVRHRYLETLREQEAA